MSLRITISESPYSMGKNDKNTIRLCFSAATLIAKTQWQIYIGIMSSAGLLSPLSWTTAADVVLILLSVIAEGVATCCPRWWDWRLYNETRSNGVRDCHHKNTERDRASLSSWLKFRNKKRKIDDKIDENNTQKMLKLINQIYLGVN